MNHLNGKFPKNGHPVHDLSSLFRSKGLPEHLKAQHLSVNGAIFGDESDRILDNLETIKKSMEITGVGKQVRSHLWKHITVEDDALMERLTYYDQATEPSEQVQMPRIPPGLRQLLEEESHGTCQAVQ